MTWPESLFLPKNVDWLFTKSLTIIDTIVRYFVSLVSHDALGVPWTEKTKIDRVSLP
jgi:hypothetical protein